jgi:RNA polymerase sigma factor (sigma-70 family)
MSPAALVEQLAEQHQAHLRWLRARVPGPLAPDEAEDVLQGAYARALSALSAPAPERPHFARPAQATAWLRTIALNHARDVARERWGRESDTRKRRPVDARLDDGAWARLVDDVDVEAQVLHAVERDTRRRAVLEAIARLDDRHRQILQLRYGRDFSPAAIMVLAGLDRRQWEGRHSRALKAFGRALARGSLTPECRRTRSLLKASPAAFLEAGSGAGEHVASCLACAAFADAARFAVATLPLPLAIEAWRLDAAEVLSPSSTSGSPAGVPPASPGVQAGAVAASTSASTGVVVTLGAVLVAGLAAGALSHDPRPPVDRGLETRAATAATARAGTRLAVHLTPRQALERAARDADSRRAPTRRPGLEASRAEDGTDVGDARRLAGSARNEEVPGSSAPEVPITEPGGTDAAR